MGSRVVVMRRAAEQAPRLRSHGLLLFGLLIVHEAGLHEAEEKTVFHFCALTTPCDMSEVLVRGWNFVIHYAQRKRKLLFGDDFPMKKLRSSVKELACGNKSNPDRFLDRANAWRELVDGGCQAAMLDYSHENHLKEAAWLEKNGVIVFYFTQVRYFGQPREDTGKFRDNLPLTQWPEGKKWTSVWNAHYAGPFSYHAVEVGQQMGARKLCILYNSELPQGVIVAHGVRRTWEHYVGSDMVTKTLSFASQNDMEPPPWQNIFTEECISADFLYVYMGTSFGDSETKHLWLTHLLRFLCSSGKVYDLMLFYGMLNGAAAGLGEQVADILASYVFDEHMWHHMMRREGDYFIFKSNKAFIDAFRREFSTKPCNAEAMAANAAVIILAAILRARSTNTKEVNDAILHLSNDFQTFIGPVIWYDSNLFGRDLLLVQLQPTPEGSKTIPVAPQKYSRGEAIFPAPRWEDRHDNPLTLCRDRGRYWVWPAVVLTAVLLFCCFCCGTGFARLWRCCRRSPGGPVKMTDKMTDVEMTCSGINVKVTAVASEGASPGSSFSREHSGSPKRSPRSANGRSRSPHHYYERSMSPHPSDKLSRSSSPEKRDGSRGHRSRSGSRTNKARRVRIMHSRDQEISSSSELASNLGSPRARDIRAASGMAENSRS